MGAEREFIVHVSRLFYAYSPIQPWVYPKTLGAFPLLLGGEGRDEGELKTIVRLYVLRVRSRSVLLKKKSAK